MAVDASSPEDVKISPKSRMEKEFFGIVLGVLGIIQGFVLNQVAEIFAKGDESIYQQVVLEGLSSNKSYMLVHFALSVFIIIRVFQTYLLAALDYRDWQTSFLDITSIFMVGIIQYWIFVSLDCGSRFQASQFHLRVSVIAILSALLHIKAYIRIRKFDKSSSAQKRDNELFLQKINAALSSSTALYCLLSYFNDCEAMCACRISVLAIGLISVNIIVSLKMTFDPVSS